MNLSGERLQGCLLLLSMLIAGSLALLNIGVGAPQVNIDDFSLYEGGFLVWFGNAPPQHAYLECWLNGLSSLVTFFGKSVAATGSLGFLDLEFVSKAYSDFYYSPDGYYAAYRLVMIVFFLSTGYLVYRIGKRCIGETLNGYGPVVGAALFLFSFNAYWCNLAGRPDTLVAFFAMLGLLFYLRADYQENTPDFWLASVAFGVAAGLKLHGAFFAIFAALDLLRVKGVRAGIRGAVLMGGLSFLFFLIADGALLFDPLKYVKARMLTYGDDMSLYIKWGQQLISMLRGSGWVILPLTLWSLVLLKGETRKHKVASLVFISLCWILLFSSIRQLRAYWMLPALPLFYLAALVMVDRLGKLRWGAVALILMIFLGQSGIEVRQFHQAPYNELRFWVQENFTPEDSAYLVGYRVLKVPLAKSSREEIRTHLEKLVREDARNFGFTHWHLKNWEELTAIRLDDMLIPRAEEGYRIVGYLDKKANFAEDLDFLQGFNYMIVQDRFGVDQPEAFRAYLQKHFSLQTERIGEGGEGYGLNYKIYKRNRAL